MASICTICKKSPLVVDLKRQADATISVSGVACPITRLNNGTWLYDRSEKDVYRLLIDAYCLCVENIYNMEGEAETDSIYGVVRPVKRCAKSDIIENYGDSQFPKQLRIFAEAVYGQAPGGTNGTAMSQMMVAME
ncbi:putative MYND domain protein [Ilyonectria destructans]|nr:putative MYND domain protein [Ilyonectria destructans]